MALPALIDSHCHLDSDRFAADREDVLSRAAARGVTQIVMPAVDRASWDALLTLAQRPTAPRLHACLGLHPVSLVETPAREDERLLAALAAHATRERRALVAIGECGLDAVVDPVRAPLARQEEVLRAQLVLARRLGLPVILHGRGAPAYSRLLALLREPGAAPLTGVVHSYSGGAVLVPAFMELGLHLGYAGPATYPDARKVRASIAATAPERLLLETDAPDQTPVPHRPGRCEPAYAADVLLGVAATRGLALDEAAALTTANARRLFALP